MHLCMHYIQSEIKTANFNWNLTSGSLHATSERIDRIIVTLDSLVYQIEFDDCNLVPARFLASTVGRIISLTHSIGKLVRLKTRALYRCIDTRASWNAPVMVDQEAYEEIKFWRREVRSLNEKGLNMECDVQVEIEAYSDASAVGYGGYISLGAGACLEGTEVVGAWDCEEAEQSSSWREISAVERVLKSNIEALENKKVKWFTDNQNVKKIINSGSKKSRSPTNLIDNQ